MSWADDLKARLEREPWCSGEQACLVVEAICAEWGGERIYIPKRHEHPQITHKDTPQTIQQRYNVSRATAYNWVNAWRR
jgi:hypothetical protein